MEPRQDNELADIGSLIKNSKSFFDGINALDQYITNPKNINKIAENLYLKQQIQELNTYIIIQIATTLTTATNTAYTNFNIHDANQVSALSERYNFLSNHIIRSMWSATSYDAQRMQIERWINIADHLYKSGNYFDSQSIISKLGGSVLSMPRSPHSVEALSLDAKEKFEKMTALFNSAPLNIIATLQKEKGSLSLPPLSTLLNEIVQIKEQVRDKEERINAINTLFQSVHRTQQIKHPNSDITGHIYDQRK